jgi:hypothetical protein
MSTRAATLTGPRAALRTAGLGVIGITLALGGAMGLSRAASAQEPLVITAGGGDGTAVVNAFRPGALTIETGSTVTFLVGSDQPQTITLGDGPDDQDPADWPVSGWPDVTGQPEGGEPADLGVASWAGSGFLNSGPVPVRLRWPVRGGLRGPPRHDGRHHRRRSGVRARDHARRSRRGRPGDAR